MSSQLVVTQPFGDYARGQLITDADEMHAVLKTHAPNVHKIPVDEPEPAPAPAPAKHDDKPTPKPDPAPAVTAPKA